MRGEGRWRRSSAGGAWEEEGCEGQEGEEEAAERAAVARHAKVQVAREEAERAAKKAGGWFTGRKRAAAMARAAAWALEGAAALEREEAATLVVARHAAEFAAPAAGPACSDFNVISSHQEHVGAVLPPAGKPNKLDMAPMHKQLPARAAPAAAAVATQRSNGKLGQGKAAAAVAQSGWVGGKWAVPDPEPQPDGALTGAGAAAGPAPVAPHLHPLAAGLVMDPALLL